MLDAVNLGEISRSALVGGCLATVSVRTQLCYLYLQPYAEKETPPKYIILNAICRCHEHYWRRRRTISLFIKQFFLVSLEIYQVHVKCITES